MRTWPWNKPIFSRSEERRINEAIAQAESGHRGEIQVFVEARYPGDGPVARAAALFDELGLTKTREGTGVLLYVAAADRRVAVWAGPGIHGATDQSFWRDVAAEVAQGFARRDGAGGIIKALAQVQRLLRDVAPGEDRAGNELADRMTQR